MQYYIFILIAFVFTTNASTTTINAKQNNQNADRGISQFFKDLKNDVILPPINNLAQCKICSSCFSVKTGSIDLEKCVFKRLQEWVLNYSLALLRKVLVNEI
jgi:hypothetical protein